MKKITALLITLALILGLCACAQSAATWQEQYDLGVRYLSEGNYQEAIIAFTAAIEIDPKQAEVYLNLADAYIALGDLDSALQTLQDGYAATGDARLQARIDELTAPEPSSEPTPVPTPEPMPEPAAVVVSGECGDNVTWSLDERGTLTINGFGPMRDFDGDSLPWKDYLRIIYGAIIENNVTNIGECAFLGCNSLTSVVIPDSVTSIGDDTFCACDSLTSVTIPASVTSINDGAFDHCDNLKDVYYGGSEAQWNQIAINSGNEPLLNATIHFDS